MICGKTVKKSQEDIEYCRKMAKKEFFNPEDFWEKKILENIDAFDGMSPLIRKNIILEAFGEKKGKLVLESFFGQKEK
jgi:hypothetical protein